MLPGWWRTAACIVAIACLFFGGYWLKGIIAEAAQARVLREQLEANREAQDRVSAIAEATEKQLAAERRKVAELNRKWSKVREAESHSVCALDDDTIGLLREAREPARVPAR